MKFEKRQLPKLNTLARMSPSSLNDEERTVEIVITTDEPALMGFWEQYLEILSMDPEHVRLARLQSGRAPLLNNHKAMTLENQIGVIERAWLVGSELRGLVRFSKRADVEPIWQDVRDGILKNISVGYRVHKYLEVTTEPDAKSEKVRTYKAIDWEPFEASLVCVPADASAGVRSMVELQRAEGEEENPVEVELLDQTEMQVSETENKNEKPQDVIEPVNETTTEENVNELELKKQAQQEERKRANAIRKAVKAAGFDVEVAEEMVERELTIEQANAELIDKLAIKQASEQAAIKPAAPSIEVTRDEIETRREAMSEALLARANPGLFQMTEKGKKFQGMSLLRLAQIMVGRGAEMMSNAELAKRAMGTSDFPLIMGNVAAKSLRRAYDVEPKTFMPWTVMGTLPDFKEMSRIQVGDVGDLADVPEHGEYQYSSMGESAEKIKLGKKGLKIKITEEMLINDDLSAMSRVPQLMGNAAARAESKAVYDILLNNPNMSDATALFHANHGNLGSAATIPNGMSAARALMRKQKTGDGKDFLALSPAFLIVGPDKEVEALQTLSAQLVAAKSADVNVFANSATPIVENRITGNKWFLVASPSQIDTIEIAYLDGMAGPLLETFAKPEDDCVVMKIKHVFGVKALDYRGMVYNPGA